MFTGMICLIGISPRDISWDIGNQTSLVGESTISFDGFPSYKPSLYRVLSHIFPWFSHDFRTSQLAPFKIVPVSWNGSAPAAHSSVGNQSAAWKRPGQTSPVGSRLVFLGGSRWAFMGIPWGFSGRTCDWHLEPKKTENDRGFSSNMVNMGIWEPWDIKHMGFHGEKGPIKAINIRIWWGYDGDIMEIWEGSNGQEYGL